jgi:transposase
MSKDHLSDRDLLPEAAQLSVLAVEKSDGGWIVSAEGANFAICPLCGNRSRARHSRYWRQFKDLPVQGIPVNLKIRLGRWHCRNSTCERKIFTERIPAVAAPYSQRTKRMDEVVRLVGHGLGGRPAEKLMKRLGMGVSDDTILRRLKKGRTPSHVPELPRVLGVDEWAWKKGQQNYGTILVDLERHVVADLMPERSASRLAEWLRKRPSVEIVSRDRYGLYAQGAQQGAPQAIQIADRFHLLLNLREAVQCELSRRRRFLLLTPPTDSTVPKAQESPTGGAAKSWRDPEVAAHNQDLVCATSRETGVVRDSTCIASLRKLCHLDCKRYRHRTETRRSVDSIKGFARTQ